VNLSTENCINDIIFSDRARLETGHPTDGTLTLHRQRHIHYLTHLPLPAVRRHDEILLEVPGERAEEAARMLQEILERIGSQLLHPVPARAQASVLATLAG